MAATSAMQERTATGHFAPGTSGNPLGARRVGSNADAILLEGAPRVARRMIALAMAGDAAAAEVVLRHGLHLSQVTA